MKDLVNFASFPALPRYGIKPILKPLSIWEKKNSN